MSAAHSTADAGRTFDDEVMTAIRLTFGTKEVERLSFKRWKDGIDIDVPTAEAVLFAKQMWAIGATQVLAEHSEDRKQLSTIPDLVKALETLLSDVESLGPHLVYNAPTMAISASMEIARAALAAAKGAK